jgi:hypothetical protein
VGATEDKDLALTVLRAYNDWQVDEWCGSHPGRFMPMGLPALWTRCSPARRSVALAAKGVHSVTFTENP